MDRPQAVSAYDSIARLYDPWSSSVVEDVSFYVDEALAAKGEVVELGVGTGRIAIPTALAGVHLIGVDSSAEMLAVCAERAREAGVPERLDLRLGDLRRPPVDERVPLVTCPFRAYLHLRDDAERLEALRAARELLRPGGRLVFDVFTPSREDSDTPNVDHTPDAFRSAWRKADLVANVVDLFANAVDPAKTEGLVHRLRPGNAWTAGILPIVADPQFNGIRVVLHQPGTKIRSRSEEDRLS